MNFRATLCSFSCYRFRQLYSVKTDQYQSFSFLAPNDIVATRINKHGKRKFDRLIVEWTNGNGNSPRTHRQLWSARHEPPPAIPPWQNGPETPRAVATAILPVDMDVIVLGYGKPLIDEVGEGFQLRIFLDDGLLRRAPLHNLTVPGEQRFDKTSTIPLSGSVHCIELITNTRTGDPLIVGGSDDGSVAFWAFR